METSEQFAEKKSERLTCLLGASPVSHFHKQACAGERQTTATSGLKCLESFERQSPLGLLEKTLLGSSLWHSTACAMIWKRKVTKSGRLLFQLAPLGRRTSEIGFGLLPTPTLGGIDDTNDRAFLKKQLHAHFFRATGWKLQPSFVEWMMGFPTGWTVLKPSVTPLFPQSPIK